MKNIFSIIIIYFLTLTLSGQTVKDSVSTEVINVVTSYKPTISDAFKAKENPVIKTTTRDKNSLEYSIKSSPIRSVFTPNPGGYKAAKTIKKDDAYPDYLKVGYGNYGTPLIESFTHATKEEHEAHFFLYNKASNGGIKGISLDDNYLNTKMELNYKNTQNTHTWETTLGYHRDLYNWYGIPLEYDQVVLDQIDEEQIYNRIFLKGKLNIHSGSLKTIEASFSNFSDAFGSKETTIKMSPSFEFPLQKNKIITTFNLDILNGKFDQQYNSLESINYGFVTFDTQAFYPIQREDLYVSLGMKLIFNADLENKNNSFLIYPDVNIDYVIIDELLNVYGEFTGGLTQNSYNTIASQNPFVSPTLTIKPTSNSYNISAGLKGKITTTISYDVKASYLKEKDKLLFRLNNNLTDGTNVVTNGYQAGNSFYSLYDNVNTFKLFGELKASLTKDIESGASLTINSYAMKNEAEAWNLPPFIANIFGTYQHNKWSGKAELFTKGKRKDLMIQQDNSEIPVFLDAYADMNISVNYAFNKKWSAFLDLNNLFNKNYEVYSNYQVQGFQILGGFIYRFDL